RRRNELRGPVWVSRWADHVGSRDRFWRGLASARRQAGANGNVAARPRRPRSVGRLLFLVSAPCVTEGDCLLTPDHRHMSLWGHRIYGFSSHLLVNSPSRGIMPLTVAQPSTGGAWARVQCGSAWGAAPLFRGRGQCSREVPWLQPPS